MALEHALSGEVISIRPFGESFGVHRTAALTKTEDLELIRIVLEQGRTVPAHAIDGPLVLQCIEGHVSVSLDEATIKLTAGDLIHLKRGATHELLALENSSLLLTIIFVR